MYILKWKEIPAAADNKAKALTHSVDICKFFHSRFYVCVCVCVSKLLWEHSNSSQQPRAHLVFGLYYRYGWPPDSNKWVGGKPK